MNRASEIKSGTQTFVPKLGLNKIVINSQQNGGLALTSGRYKIYSSKQDQLSKLLALKNLQTNHP